MVPGRKVELRVLWPVTPEGKVKADIKAWLTAQGVWFYMPVQNGMGVAGIPDIIACWHGLFLAIEVKAPGKLKNVTKLQRFQLDSIEKAGGIALAVDDVRQLELMMLVRAPGHC